MVLVEKGRVCIKRFGRDAGEKAVITKVIDKNFVGIVTKTRPKERKCNIKHLEFLNEKIDASNTSNVEAYLEIKRSAEKHTAKA
ncbi:MAG: 50S ribosomal protein L14e [Candidatus Marsarchaeota archaeon]|jgi:ribosomal protein L14E/L6E/L27E|nr:50S ribosomal protein L14e [Candidatus Marsarchaeota archaeon]